MNLVKTLLPLLLFSVTACGINSAKHGDEKQAQQQPSINKKKGHPNILFITVDTLRSDRVGCYGNNNIKTPNMDELARGGVLFENAYSVQPVTLPSHTSMLTGQYPFNTGVRDNNIYKVKEETVTLAEHLKANGYITTAFVAAYILNHKFGLNQGFDFYNDKFITPKQKGRLPVDRRASEVSLLATEWQKAMKDKIAEKPFFLWLHYYDPHADYDPPEPYKSAYPNPYDGEIAYTDDWLGFLFKDLKKNGLWENTIVVLMADHGDSLGEHGENTHGMFIYSATTHVPLLIRYPEKLPSNKRIPDRVSGVDLIPTILELADLPPIKSVDGLSLVDLIINDKHLKSRPVYSEVFIPRSFGWSELKGVRQDDLFYIDAPIKELYKNEMEWTKLDNLIDEQPEDTNRLQSAIDEMIASGIPLEKSDSVAMDEDMIMQLASLGYFVNSEKDQSSSDQKIERPDPKNRIHIFNMYQRATSLMSRGGYTLAMPILKQVVKEDPENARFVSDLANVLVELKKYDEAQKYLIEIIKAHPTDAKYTLQLADSYIKSGNENKALDAFNATLVLDPLNVNALFNGGMLYINMKKWAEAKELFKKIIKENPKNAKAINNLGYILIKGENKIEEGIALITKALDTNPNNTALILSLASAYMTNNDFLKAQPLLEKAQKIMPQNPQVINDLLKIYKKTGNKQKFSQLQQNYKTSINKD
ncbi:MAG: sulfatase-like hydrolase/transferase [Deltaproteobacteria bacterium]|nr:sulfatase-like hydrolase/transferase [Deltaproteobacteria bacterium]